MTKPRRFELHRTTDTNGVAGTGHVADGIVFSDGHAAIHWLSRRRTTTPHPDGIESVEEIHCYDDNTRIVWLDEDATDPLAVLDAIETEPRYTPAPGCPHCPDGHTPPDHGQPWHVRTDQGFNEDRPQRLIVERAAGAHVAESDAQWLRDLINRATEA